MSKLMDYALELESECKYQDALTYFEMVMEEKGCPYDIRFYIGRVLNKMGQYEKALRNFDLVLTMDDKHAGSWFGKGISNLGLGNWVDAYNSFVKSIKFGDSDNANNWYYLAVIGKSFKEVKNDALISFFNKFKDLDSEKYSQERSKYKFGLYFDYLENKLFKRKTINIKGFKEQFRLYDLDEDEINLFLKTLSYEQLIEIIKELKKEQYENNVKNICSNEFNKMGLSEDEINGMFDIVDSVDDIKNEVILMNPEIQFPELDTNVDIPLYVRTPFEEFVHKNKTDEFYLIRNISSKNVFTKILNPMGRSSFLRDILNLNPNKSRFNAHKYRIIRTNGYFNSARTEFHDKNYGLGEKYLKKAHESCPYDYYNRYNILYYYATFYSLWDNINYKFEAYKLYKKLESKIGYYKNQDVFILNMANVTYDLSQKNPAFIEESMYYYKEYLHHHPDSMVVLYLIKTLDVYKSQNLAIMK